MSYRHPLQQSYTVDYLTYSKRQPSNGSSVSSTYSNSSGAFIGLSRTSTLSSTASSGYQLSNHKRGVSETTGMSPIQMANSPRSLPGSLESSPDGGYRQTLRPHTQTLVGSGTAAPIDKSNNYHTRGGSVDAGRNSYYDAHNPSPLTKSIAMRPNSMILSRADSINCRLSTSTRGARALPPTPLNAPDLESLQKSSTGHLRTLSAFAQTASAEEFSVDTPGQDVVGLYGRRKLRRNDAVGNHRSTVVLTSKTNDYSWAGRNWMDKQRQFLQAYEYLCHIGEAKEWIERIIDKSIPMIVELEEALRDGVTLAEVVEALQPHRRFRIFRHPKLQYRHSDNIAIFFRFLNEVELPELFRFELIDLYEKKNIPKVIYCIHALSWLLFRQGVVDFRIGNLVGRLEFEHHELEAMQDGLDKAGVSMPSFGNMGADFGVEPTPEPEPAETEDERIDRELHENEIIFLDLQAQIRGAAIRMRLGNMMQKLWDSEGMLVGLQARIRGDFARQISDYRISMRRFAINLQSAARGFLMRNRQTGSKAFWKSKEAEILKLQSLIRARRARDEVRVAKSRLQREEVRFVGLQAAIKGFIARKEVATQCNEAKSLAVPTKGLQAAIRGMLLRLKTAQKITYLRQQEGSISAMQAVARAMLTRDQIFQQRRVLQASSPIWRAFQAVSRGKLLRDNLLSSRKDLKSHTKGIVSLQSMIRGAAIRRDVKTTLSKIESEGLSVLKAQALIRGMIVRQSLANDHEALEMQSAKIAELQAHARALLLRKTNQSLLQSLRVYTAETTDLQSLARAMLLRDDIGILLGELEAEEDSVTALQAAARGLLIRATFAEKQRHFKENMEKVVKIQSFVRGRLQGEAYKSLTTGKNPPVNAVKNFVHLLNDSDFDFNEEIEFERLRKTVVQQVRQNEMAEQYIDQLDIKIALLVKNKITLDDVMQHQRTFGGHTGSLLSNTPMSSGNQFDLKALNKNSRKKLESYQQLFFTLQTQPQYLARLFKRIREEGRAEQECKRIETLMMGLFGYAQKRREEYYLLRLIARSVKEEVDGSASITDYLRGNYFWSKLFANYTRSPRDRKFLRDLLGPLVRENIIEDPSLDLESDPMQIYRSAINNEELRTGQPSRRPLNIPREVAIKDKETRDMFIDHLRDLREISDQFLVALEDLLHKMPYGIRFISQQTFQSLCERFPREPQQYLLQIVGQWVWRFYLQPALTSPEQVGVIERQLSPLQKRNLGEVSKVLSQVSLGKIFGGENIYLQPLNAYVGDAIERMGHIITNLISVPDAESTFDIDEFNDLYAKTKPTLYIKMADIFAIHNLVAAEIPQICPNRDDMLREIVLELGSAKNNESEMLGVSSSEIQMTLNPKLHDVEDPEAEVKALFMETKRCVLYIIRVQSGPNLMEILVRNISPEDDEKWQALLREEFAAGSNTRGAYSDANTLVDITSMSYLALKRTALENIMKLEKIGRISRHNYYQDILNAIALDIRTKSRRRIQRQRELEGVRLTLGNLHEKAVYLEQQRKSYDNYIEQAMLTLQNKKGYVYVLICLRGY
jgi:Ras GTPase-activating-like protein IQGAP2/3